MEKCSGNIDFVNPSKAPFISRYNLLISIFRPGSIEVDAKLYIINMDDKRRLELCDIANGLLNDVSPVNIATHTITNLKIQNLGKI